MPHALVIEDDRSSLDALDEFVRQEGFSSAKAQTVEEARAAVVEEVPDLALVDLQLPDGSGMELIRELQAAGPTQVVVITGDDSVQTAVKAMHEGVVDYLTKPLDPKALRRMLRDLKRWLETRKDVLAMRETLRKTGRFGILVGASPAMQRVYELVGKVAPTRATVLVTGETGTGKELVARTVHDLSRRAGKPFVAVNCGAIQPTLIESELFGHEPGSFTGASKRRKGLFERADGGTLFLDEVTEMPAELQVKLLRVLETRSFERVGGETSIEVDVRVVAATNRDPEEAVGDDKLREDLLYRLQVFTVHVPPLRERLEDVELLASFFLESLEEEGEESPRRLTAAAIERLKEHAWPGNARELRNVIERATILGGREIGPDAIALTEGEAAAGGAELSLRVGTSIKDAERELILATLEHYGDDKKRAAKVLGISLKTLYNRLREYRGS